jgi:hypothetical protein
MISVKRFLGYPVPSVGFNHVETKISILCLVRAEHWQSKPPFLLESCFIIGLTVALRNIGVFCVGSVIKCQHHYWCSVLYLNVWEGVEPRWINSWCAHISAHSVDPPPLPHPITAHVQPSTTVLRPRDCTSITRVAYFVCITTNELQSILSYAQQHGAPCGVLSR